MKNFIFSRDGQFSVYGGVLVAGDIEAYRIGVDMGTDTSGMSAMAVCQENGEYSGDYQALGNRIFVTLANSMYSTPGYITIRLAVSKNDSVITAKEIRFKVAPPNNSEILAENERGTIDTILTAVTKAEDALSQLENYALKADTYTKKEIDGKSEQLKTEVYTKQEIDSKISAVYSYRGSYKSFDTLTLYTDILMSAKVGYVWNIAEAGTILPQFSMTGEEVKINAGDNIVIVEEAVGTTPDGAPKFDVLAGTVDLSNFHTKTEVYDLILEEREYLVNGYYNKTEVGEKIAEEAMLSARIFAEKSDVYTKSEIDTMLSAAIDSAIGDTLGGEY